MMNASQNPVIPGSTEADEIELSIHIEKYGRENFPVEHPHPLEAINFRMDQMDLKQNDMAPLIGSKTRISEVLNKKDLYP